MFSSFVLQDYTGRFAAHPFLIFAWFTTEAAAVVFCVLLPCILWVIKTAPYHAITTVQRKLDVVTCD